MPRRPPVLRPGTPVLRRAPGELQYGTDPRWSVRLVGLTDAEERWLRSLERRAPRSRPRAADPPEERRAALLRVLDDANLLVAPRPGRGRSPSPAPGGGDGDLAVLSALRPDGDGHRTLERRARSLVAVAGLGRLGAALAATLATAGVGSLVLRDPAPVLATDVGPGGYRVRDVGSAREEALRRSVGEITPTVAVGVGEPREVPDVVVVVERAVADARRVRALVGEGVPHLSVVVREAGVLVGPFVRPGKDPCLTCLDLHRADGDPCWPQLSQQLVGQRGTQHEETVLAAVGAATAAGQVLAALDGSVPRTATACLEIIAPDAVPRLRGTVRHPRCGCGDLRVTPPDGAPVAMSGRARGGGPG